MRRMFIQSQQKFWPVFVLILLFSNGEKKEGKKKEKTYSTLPPST